MSPVRAKLAVVLALSLLTALSGTVWASSSSTALMKGSQALQFGLGYDFKLSPFQGATISYERLVRDNLGLRLGAQISTDYSEGSFTDETARDGLSGTGEVDLAKWNHVYSVACHLISYRPGQVALYYGGGPKVSYSNNMNEYYDYYVSDSGPNSSWYRSWRRTWGVGLEGAIGAQWILNDRFRLLAEYATSVMYGRQFEEDTRTYTGTSSSSEKETYDRYFVQVAPQNVKVGLAVSF